MSDKTTRQAEDGGTDTTKASGAVESADERDASRLYQSTRRYTANEEILKIERELQADGVELANPAKPFRDHPTFAEYSDDPAEIRSVIQTEVASEDPNRDKIGMLNRLLEALDGDGDE